MVDAMGHEQWREWQAFDRIYPIQHSQRMLGLITQFLANFKTSDGQAVTMPWNVEDAPETAAQRDAATAAVAAVLPGHRIRPADTRKEFIL